MPDELRRKIQDDKMREERINRKISENTALINECLERTAAYAQEFMDEFIKLGIEEMQPDYEWDRPRGDSGNFAWSPQEIYDFSERASIKPYISLKFHFKDRLIHHFHSHWEGRTIYSQSDYDGGHGFHAGGTQVFGGREVTSCFVAFHRGFGVLTEGNIGGETQNLSAFIDTVQKRLAMLI